ncbi:hypothetical protein B0O80DRAFT_9538 [Mortierella sp. GBAus27b]|nr:hypothetical protein B0O80DRAFT_9538 [Mortierella sp. GBAus27b]
MDVVDNHKVQILDTAARHRPDMASHGCIYLSSEQHTRPSTPVKLLLLPVGNFPPLYPCNSRADPPSAMLPWLSLSVSWLLSMYNQVIPRDKTRTLSNPTPLTNHVTAMSGDGVVGIPMCVIASWLSVAESPVLLDEGRHCLGLCVEGVMHIYFCTRRTRAHSRNPVLPILAAAVRHPETGHLASALRSAPISSHFCLLTSRTPELI